ncbi:hypothetical protein [Blastococcus sp. PRF04-17]|uniref:hypothetical protein n=1 Tax=Blastococcus sp. PRF04-17 TaxID=2933797 RepID=UPI001FF18B37|nr:hypothetical protein [Blastococcus sp. PRF04-17]UOY01838.1 hypothetical protein MVA48_00155 [Blastococcus sp. PRF04-17]
MSTPSLPSVPVRTADDLTRRWTGLLDPPVFGARSLWLSWIGVDGLMSPIVIPVDGLPERPDAALLVNLRNVSEGVIDAHLDGSGHLAMALCRPGRPEITPSDDEWAEEFRAVFDDGRIDGTWSLHLAAGGSVVPLVDLPA